MYKKLLFNYLKTTTVFLLLGFSAIVCGKNNVFLDGTNSNRSILIGNSLSGGSTICSGSSSGLLTLSDATGPVLRWEYSNVSPYTSWTTIANTATITTYTSEPLTQTTYFRAVIQDKAFGEVYSSSEIITILTTTTIDGGLTWDNDTPTNTKAAIFNGSIGTITADFSACSLVITNNATVTVNAGIDVTLSLNGAIEVSTGSSFTLSNTAMLMQSGTTNSNLGSIVVERNSSAIKRFDYTIWSSPVSGQGLYSFSPFTFANRFYVYRPTTNLFNNADIGFNITGLDANGVNGTDSNNVQFTTGKGYLIRVPWNHPTTANVWNGIFTGVPNNGDLSIAMTTGYNAIGNPYPSKINVNDFIDGNLNITGPIYIWRKTNDNTNATTSYSTLTKIAYVSNGALGGDISADSFPSGNEANWILNVGQGFVVNVTNDSNLNFTNSMRRSTNEDHFFRNSQTVTTTNSGLYWLNLINNTGVYSQMAVSYSPEGTSGDDRGIDGKNMNPDFYLTSLIGTNEYSIQGRPDFNASDTVPLSYKVATSGNYTISIDHTAGAFTSDLQPIYLKDNLTGVLHNLKTGSYSFTSSNGAFTNRFEVVYQTALGIDNQTFTENNVVIVNQNNEFVIKTDKSTMSSVKVFDISGRLIQEHNDINANQTTIDSGLSRQVLLFQITSAEGLIVTKKVIK